MGSAGGGSVIPKSLPPPPCLPAPAFPGQVAHGLYNALKPRNSSSRYTTARSAMEGENPGWMLPLCWT